jgi:hypothetical protein
VNPVDTVPLMLLVLHLLALGVGTMIFFGMIVVHRRARETQRAAFSDIKTILPDQALAQGPVVWLAIHSTDSDAVLASLGVSNPVPCPWREGIAGERELFIGPPVQGWIMVTGSRLPQPAQDVDACFYFLIRLSRALGHVQFFMVDIGQHHHAWARLENGTVMRAYAWVNETVWNQGIKSLAEVELNLKCFNYGESPDTDDWTTAEIAAANVEKVPALAARWSFDPAVINDDGQIPADGVAGTLSRFHQD